ncbi:hypothetical protein Moror_14058 [Moniliophthora roreri MCA 2997]|uniref:Uncharacterized protein n=2 Tax=Moniliophthora roreri TaxID=221103 RepID=V2XPV4_MONRO|nr:hypothetical protein Moror_14058 [Moniliophthora roreri MCA 2997]KAI3619694.1 hypothetical protein WG66_002832 [Moniliophthora roreri]
MEDSAAEILVLLVIYYLFERCIKALFIRQAKPFFDYLYFSHKLPVFTGIAMGALITVITTPACFRAAFTQGDDFDAKVCFVGRGVLWVSELNRLDLYELYVVHHLGGLLALCSTVTLRWPYRPVLVLFASLVSEIPGDFVWMLSAYRDYREGTGQKADSDSGTPLSKTIHQALVVFNLLQYVLLRFPAMIYSFYIVWIGEGTQRMSQMELNAAFTMMVAHAAFCIAYVIRQLRTIRRNVTRTTPPQNSLTSSPPIISFQSEHQPYHITFNALGSQWYLTVYGLFMGLSLSSLALCVSALCPTSESNSLIKVISCSVLGARIFSLIFEDGLKQFVYAPISTCLRPGFWLHGGIAGAAVSSSYLYHIGAIPSIDAFCGALAVGLPLYEFFSRIGCHCYGCCYGRPLTQEMKNDGKFLFVGPAIYSHPFMSALARAHPSWVGVPLLPIQLVSAVLFLVLFLFIAIPLVTLVQIPLASAGCIVLFGHSTIRLWTEKYRADYRGKQGVMSLSTTGVMAVLQPLASVLGIMWMNSTKGLEQASGVHLDGLHWPSILFSLGLGVLVYGGHRGKIGQWI